MANNQGIQLKCPRCGNEWTYTGKNEYKAPCSYCGVQVFINTNKIPEVEEDGTGT